MPRTLLLLAARAALTWTVLALLVASGALTLGAARCARAQEAAVLTQTIRGRVVDAVTRAPLPGAAVLVVDSEPLLGTSTDAGGAFVLRGVPLGRQDLLVRFLGYEPALVAQVLVTSAREVVLEVALREAVLTGEEVVVTAEPGRMADGLTRVSARPFTVEETRRYAGGLDDPARMASAFAGMTTGGGVQENAVAVRGNAPKGVTWRLEGVEIPNPSHFADLSVAGGGGLTLFSAQVLAGGDVLTGAFPAAYGNALAGVFDLTFRQGNPARREQAVQVGLLGVEAAAEGPFVPGRAATYLVNYRYSTLGLLLPLLPTEDVATYQDLSFKLALPTRRAGRLELWGLGGLDRQAMTASADSSDWTYEVWDRLEGDLHLGMGVMGATHHLVLGRRSYLRTTAAATARRTRLDQERIGDDLVLRDDLAFLAADARLTLAADLTHKASARHTLQAGASVQHLAYELDVRAAPEAGRALAEVAAGSGTSRLVQAYAQSELALTRRLGLVAGLRLQHLALTGQTLAEPRAAVRWQVAAGQALSLAYGLHSQMEDLRIYFARGEGAEPNRSLGLARAHHVVAGYERPLGALARLRLEAYEQRLFDVPVIPDSSFSLLNFEQDLTFDAALTSDGAGRNRGLEATLERFLHGGVYALATGSVFSARYRGGDGHWRPGRFDRGYAVNLLAGAERALARGHVLGASGRVTAMGGRRRSPVDQAASRPREEVVYDAARAFAKREPALLVVDLTLTYRRSHGRRASVWALQVKNLLGAKTVAYDYNFATERVEAVREGFPLPVLSYKLEF